MKVDVRVERIWHQGHTVIVFETIGPSQIGIMVLGSEQTTTPPFDPKTGRKVQYSLGLLEDDIDALEIFLKERRVALGVKLLPHDGSQWLSCVACSTVRTRFLAWLSDALGLGEDARESDFRAEIEAAWAALGVTAEDRANNDDPDVRTLSQSIRVSLQYERDEVEAAKEALRAKVVEALRSVASPVHVPGRFADEARDECPVCHMRVEDCESRLSICPGETAREVLAEIAALGNT